MRSSFHGHDDAWQFFLEAYQLQMKGQLQEALKAYRRSINLYPTAEALTFLGWTYSFLGRLDVAIDYCRRAIEVDPEFGNPYNDIGAYLLQMNQPREAIDWLRKATQSTRYDSFHFPFANLGAAYEAIGEPYKAIASFKRALQIYPSYHHARQQLIRIISALN